MTVKVSVARRYNGVDYRIETELTSLEQTDVVGKVVRAVEEWIDTQMEIQGKF